MYAARALMHNNRMPAGSSFRALVLILAAVQASAAAIPHGTVELIAENQSIAPGRSFFLGLHFRLENGWHIYWANPGDSGQPPRATWHVPAGISVGEMQWPAPKRLGNGTIVDFGYEGATTLLVPVRAEPSLKPADESQIDADLSVLVCKDICVPGKARVSLSLPIKLDEPQPDVKARVLFAAARSSVPRPVPADWKITALNKTDFFLLVAHSGRSLHRALFFPLIESQIDNAAPQKIEPTSDGFRLILRKSDQLLKPIHRLKGVLELSAEESYQVDVPVGNGGPAKK
jgi:DsbC/DsbD-like thiol-disulfide interchange protein